MKSVLAIRIDPHISPEPETCWRCRHLGLPEGGIAPGDTYYAVYVDGRHLDDACADCFARLRLEQESAS